MSGFKDECGVFGIYRSSRSVPLAYLGLYALQHRGQEAAGIVTSAVRQAGFEAGSGSGYVADDLRRRARSRGSTGPNAIGHTRYSTSGENNNANTQPIYVECKFGEIAVCHNGNLVNAHVLRHELVAARARSSAPPATPRSSSTSTRSRCSRSREDAIVDAVRTVDGRLLAPVSHEGRAHRRCATREASGRSSSGRLGDSYVLCSETCALDLIDAEYDPRGGAGRDGRHRRERRSARCRLFAPEPAGALHFRARLLRAARQRRLRTQRPHDAPRDGAAARAGDVPRTPTSSCPSRIRGSSPRTGYSLESGLPMEFGLIRNHYVGRTFIEPRQSIRHFGVKVKLNPVRAVIEGRRVVLVDDSIVRGTTSQQDREHGPRRRARTEIHFRVSSPPTTGPCHYGIDTPRKRGAHRFDPHRRRDRATTSAPTASATCPTRA